MPNADASLPSARERSVSWATPAMDSTRASRGWRSLSFCLRVKGSSLFSRWFKPSSAAGERVAVSLFDFDGFGERFVAFFETGLLVWTLRACLEILRADRGLRAADFLVKLFFFFGLAIA